MLAANSCLWEGNVSVAEQLRAVWRQASGVAENLTLRWETLAWETDRGRIWIWRLGRWI